MSGAFSPVNDTASLGVTILGSHVKPMPASAFVQAEVWMNVHDPDALDAIMAKAETLSRNEGWDVLAAISGPSGMPLAEILKYAPDIRPTSGYAERHEHLFASLDEGRFDMAVTFGLDKAHWLEETGTEFSKESFGSVMMPTAYDDPTQIGMRLNSFAISEDGDKATVTLHCEITDGVAAGAAATTLMRECGYGDDEVPPNPGEAMAEVWMMSNDAPNPCDVGVEYVKHEYRPGPGMRPARDVPRFAGPDIGDTPEM